MAQTNELMHPTVAERPSHSPMSLPVRADTMNMWKSAEMLPLAGDGSPSSAWWFRSCERGEMPNFNKRKVSVEVSISTAGSQQSMPGVHRLELPLAGHSIDHVNVYVLEADGRLLMIDCGWSTPEARSHLEQFVVGIGYRLEDIERVLLTHLHADHAGLAGWMQSWGASVGLHQADAVQLEDRFILPQPHHDETSVWLAWAGVPESLWHSAQQQVSEQAALFWPGFPDVSLREGSVIDHGPFRLTAVHTPGHTPGSVSFYESSTRSLFSGDTLFSRSTYSPTLRPGSSEDPMSDYLNSLDRFRTLEVEWVLPGHHLPFTGLWPRIDAVWRTIGARGTDRSRDPEPGSDGVGSGGLPAAQTPLGVPVHGSPTISDWRGERPSHSAGSNPCPRRTHRTPQHLAPTRSRIELNKQGLNWCKMRHST